MEQFTLTTNAGKLRYIDVNGRQFAVARITILQPKVLAGSRGPLYYPKDEIANDPDAWNGRTMVARHPVKNGTNISANNPEVMQTQEIGRVYKSQINNDGSNSVEGWFDVEMTKKVDPRIWESLVQGKPIEVSTGLYTQNEPAPVGSQVDGKPYDYIARNYKPDHLAILMDEKGACSINDGCGVYNSDKTITDNPGWVKDHSKWEKAKAQAQKEGKSEDYAYITSIYKQMGGEISNNQSFEESMNEWLAYNAQWAQAERDKLPNDDFAGPNQSFPIRTQSDVDSAAKLIGHADNPEAVKRKIIEIAKRKGLQIPDAWKHDSSPTSNTISNEDTMNEREKVIDWLTNNCSCFKANGSKSKLIALSDNALKEVFLENAEKAVENDADMSFLNWIGNADKDIRGAFVGMMKKKLVASAGGNMQPNPDPKKQQQAPANPEPDTPEEKKKEEMMAANQKQILEAFPALKEMIANAEKFNNMVKSQEETQKKPLVDRLVSGITDNAQKQQKHQELMKLSLDNLQLMSSVLPQQTNNNNNQQLNNPVNPIVSYFGMGNLTDNQVTDNAELQKEKLELPRYDWNKISKEHNQQRVNANT